MAGFPGAAPLRPWWLPGTETRFSIYLPPADVYRGRFFQHITPVPDSENLAQHVSGEQDKIGFSISSGGYFLETNGGGASGSPGSSVDPTIAAYRANAAAARYSRLVAAGMYGEHRAYGYAYGGSGGGYRTIGGAENTSGVWDGVVPYVIGSPMAIPNMFTVRMHALRILRDRLDGIVDAVEPGGSGDMCCAPRRRGAGALTEVTRMGFPPRSWFGHRTMGMHAFPVLYQGLVMADPTYFEEFWTQPGYLGFDLPPSLRRDACTIVVSIAATISEDEAVALDLSAGSLPGQVRGGVDTAWRGSGEPPSVPVAVRLSSAPDVEVLGAELFVTSGAAAGATMILLSVVDDIAVFGPPRPLIWSSYGREIPSSWTTADFWRRRPITDTRCPRRLTTRCGTSSATLTARPCTPNALWCSAPCSRRPRPGRCSPVDSRGR